MGASAGDGLAAHNGKCAMHKLGVKTGRFPVRALAQNGAPAVSHSQSVAVASLSALYKQQLN